MNVSADPAHTAPAGDCTTVTAGVIIGLMTKGVVEAVTVVGVAQVAFDVRVTDTISPLASVAELKPGLFVPTFTPFTFH